MKTSKITYFILYLSIIILFLSGCNPSKDKKPVKECTEESIDNSLNDLSDQKIGKPVIYLYPTSEQDISVKLDFKGKLTCTYPEYEGEWKVKAQPNGTLTNISDKKEYSYLYWEGISNNKWDMSKGFVVKGTDTRKFLQEKLEYLGLTPKEYNEFIVYWLPIMQENNYNLITFAGKEYEDIAALKITPEPDSILRVMMVFKPLSTPVDVAPQELKPFIRKGFSVIEWGGTEVN
jgi:hypothetical protein